MQEKIIKLNKIIKIHNLKNLKNLQNRLREIKPSLKKLNLNKHRTIRMKIIVTKRKRHKAKY